MKQKQKRKKLFKSSKVIRKLEKQSLSTHLLELRTRVLIVLFALAIGTIIGFLIYPHILSFILTPLHKPIYYSSPIGGFDFAFTVCFTFGFLLSIPVLLYQIIKFIEPILPKYVEKMLTIYILISCFLLITGVVFAYYLGLPAILFFLNSFDSQQIHSLISTQEYMSFVTHYLFGFGILFQLPLVIILVNIFLPITPSLLLTYQRHFIVFAFILTFILTPTPDPITQIIMVLPLIILYYLAIIFLYTKAHLHHDI